MASEAVIKEFASGEEMAARLADDIAERIASAVEETGAASLALSGGSTPAGLYKALSARDLDWAHVKAALVDERWVPPGADGSNESFLRSTLQQNEAANAEIVGMWSSAPSPTDGLAAAQARYAGIKTPFDVVVLGMGPDGHTASWFPQAQGLDAALSEDGPPLAAVTARRSAVTGDHLERMTLTLGALKDAGLICLMITGPEKRAVLERALKEDGPVEDLPVRAILRARPNLTACWAP